MFYRIVLLAFEHEEKIIFLEQPIFDFKTNFNDADALTCKFNRYCKYYQANAHTCHDDKEVKSYCGARWQFDQHSKGNKNIGVNIANIFIVKINRPEDKPWKSEC
jgi:hypothetical protein